MICVDLSRSRLFPAVFRLVSLAVYVAYSVGRCVEIAGRMHWLLASPHSVLGSVKSLATGGGGVLLTISRLPILSRLDFQRVQICKNLHLVYRPRQWCE